MDREDKITIREADLGPVIARADHQEGAIEVNSSFFYRLPPMVQEFVLCHEVCHLRHDEWDEARTNMLASKLFMDRSKNAADRSERSEFLSYLDGNGGYSNFAWATLIPSVLSLGTTVYGFIKNRNAGWYSWDGSTKRSNLKVMLTQAFEGSRKTSSKSAADLFWEQMYLYTNKDGSLEKFIARSDNSWVPNYIRQFEKKYGFGFEEVTPIDITAFPLAMFAIGIVVGFIVYKIIKKIKK